MTSPDDRQPGGSGAHEDAADAALLKARLLTDTGERIELDTVLTEFGYTREQLSGGSGAGSTVTKLDLSDFAQHVVTSEWLAEVKAKFTKLQMDLAQSRATEAELRAKVEQARTVLQCVRPTIATYGGPETAALVRETLAALDAAEQPARAEGGQG